MLIRDEKLTIAWSWDFALVNLSFTVVLAPSDMKLSGGFLERVGLSPELGGLQHKTSSLMLQTAVKPRPEVDSYEMYRDHSFRVPRHPRGPFASVTFHGYIDIRPAAPYFAEKDTAPAVLPAKYSLTSAIREVVRRVRAVTKWIASWFARRSD